MVDWSHLSGREVKIAEHCLSHCICVNRITLPCVMFPPTSAPSWRYGLLLMIFTCPPTHDDLNIFMNTT